MPYWVNVPEGFFKGRDDALQKTGRNIGDRDKEHVKDGHGESVKGNDGSIDPVA